MLAKFKNNTKHARQHILKLRKYKRQVLKIINNNVTSQAISDSGRYLFAGNMNGDVFVQDLNQLDREQEQASILKCFSLPWKIYCLTFFEGQLIIGSDGVICILEWNEDRELLSTKPSTILKMPKPTHEFWMTEVNCIYVRPKSSSIIVGCSDNNVYEIDLVKQQYSREFLGHTDYIHDIVGSVDGRVFTASEDGTVRCWTSDTETQTGIIIPSTRTELERSEMGKFIGAVSVSDNFIVAGGGPKPAIFHLGSCEFVQDYGFPGTVHAIKIIEDNVFIGGMHNRAESYTLSGEKQTNIPVDMTSVFSIVYQYNPIKFMSLAGYSNNLHILKDFNFLDFKIPLYSKEGN